MSKLTRGNICYDLKVSPYNLEVPYETGDTIQFVFSSNLYKSNFYNRLYTNRTTINQSLSNRFGYKIKNDVIADMKLYTLIEKRGFLVLWNGNKVECLSDIILDGNKMIMNS